MNVTQGKVLMRYTEKLQLQLEMLLESR